MSMLTVNLGEHSYDILIDSDSLSSLGQRCDAIGLKGSVAVITNPTVASFYGETVRTSLAQAGNSVTMIEIPDGEEYKNSTTLGNVYDALIEAGLDRHSFIVALGGGVVGDLAGFAAATFMRGIPFVQVPTTLLAQVDSSVGGKTAIDHRRGKNLIGAFYQPKLVLIDVETLKTLPEREFRAGMAEVVKYGVALDFQFFEYLELNSRKILDMERESLVQVILHCCALKAQVVELDEKESGLRAVLNYGHTLGHALETLDGYRKLVHGEAVSIGSVLATRICVAQGYCTAAESARVEALLSSLGLPVIPPAVDRAKLLEALVTDKKSHGGTISFICNEGIGHYVIEKMSPEQVIVLSGLDGVWQTGAALLTAAAAPGDAAWSADLPAADGMDAEFQSFEDELDDDEIIEDLDVLDIDEADLIEEGDDGDELVAEASTGCDPLFTATMAELYVQQGFLDKALDIYRTLYRHDSTNGVTMERIGALEIMLGTSTVSADVSETSESGFDAISQGTADPVVATLEGWLDNIRRIRACR